MDILTALLVVGLLLMAGLYNAAPRYLTIGLYVAAVLVVGFSYVDEPAKIRTEHARLAKIEADRVAAIEAEELAKAKLEQQKADEAERQRKERERLKALADAKAAREKKERDDKAAEVKRKMPGSFRAAAFNIKGV